MSIKQNHNSRHLKGEESRHGNSHFPGKNSTVECHTIEEIAGGVVKEPFERYPKRNYGIEQSIAAVTKPLLNWEEGILPPLEFLSTQITPKIAQPTVNKLKAEQKDSEFLEKKSLAAICWKIISGTITPRVNKVNVALDLVKIKLKPENNSLLASKAEIRAKKELREKDDKNRKRREQDSKKWLKIAIKYNANEYNKYKSQLRAREKKRKMSQSATIEDREIDATKLTKENKWKARFKRARKRQLDVTSLIESKIVSNKPRFKSWNLLEALNFSLDKLSIKKKFSLIWQSKKSKFKTNRELKAAKAKIRANYRQERITAKNNDSRERKECKLAKIAKKRERLLRERQSKLELVKFRREAKVRKELDKISNKQKMKLDSHRREIAIVEERKARLQEVHKRRQNIFVQSRLCSLQKLKSNSSVNFYLWKDSKRIRTPRWNRIERLIAQSKNIKSVILSEKRIGSVTNESALKASLLMSWDVWSTRTLFELIVLSPDDAISALPQTDRFKRFTFADPTLAVRIQDFIFRKTEYVSCARRIDGLLFRAENELAGISKPRRVSLIGLAVPSLFVYRSQKRMNRICAIKPDGDCP